MQKVNHNGVNLVSSVANSKVVDEEQTDEYKKLVGLQKGLALMLNDGDAIHAAEAKLKEMEDKEQEPRLSFVFSELEKLTEAEALKKVESRETDFREAKDLEELLEAGTVSEADLLHVCKVYVDRFVSEGLDIDLDPRDLTWINAISNLVNAFEQSQANGEKNEGTSEIERSSSESES